MVARPRPARRPAHAGDQAHGPGSAADAVHGARLRGDPPRRRPLERRRDPDAARGVGRDHELRRRPRPEQRRRRGRVARGGGLRPVRRGAHGQRRQRRHPVHFDLRAQRPRRRLAVLRRQAALVRTARALGRGVASRDRARGGRRRLQRRPDRRRCLGCRPSPRRDPRLAAGACRVRGAARARPRGRLSAHAIRTPGATRGGTTAPACSTRTTGCGSTTCC